MGKIIPENNRSNERPDQRKTTKQFIKSMTENMEERRYSDIKRIA